MPFYQSLAFIQFMQHEPEVPVSVNKFYKTDWAFCDHNWDGSGNIIMHMTNWDQWLYHADFLLKTDWKMNAGVIGRYLFSSKDKATSPDTYFILLSATYPAISI